MRILKVGHENICAAVQRIDDHLAIDRPRDLDSPVPQIGGNRTDAPCGLADPARLRKKLGQRSRVQRFLNRHAPCKQLESPTVKSAMQVRDESKCCGRQNTLKPLGDRTRDFNSTQID